ncbi:MAG: hypothetical protein PHE73_08885 [Sulfurovaceae bacterium]|nr:hypothetical protein [Sulfurovaceae bacterium]
MSSSDSPVIIDMRKCLDSVDKAMALMKKELQNEIINGFGEVNFSIQIKNGQVIYLKTTRTVGHKIED